jgi:hypothetical protein
MTMVFKVVNLALLVLVVYGNKQLNEPESLELLKMTQMVEVDGNINVFLINM